ncbi:MerR family transcriptional regulator [Paenibacillus hexagrammi]|uniref:MerR family transcriptional regulator n=1 Tax=Paenibacillus hexagrammi TaxID=2908839 RepID=A0ABY3SLD6_9BACL|nr:MerR family transcriptional regulator [Paenibacillus sp. YPD9-1]UJF34355.1 MerR family transcriptional regulator [Paenibacillus sp. YPD9-1]
MDKQWNIQQISEHTGLSAHTLRYYEKIGLMRHVSRDASGYRQYTEADLSWLEFLIRLRDMGMPIAQMKRYAQLRSQGDSTVTERRRLLEEHHHQVKRHIEELLEHAGSIEKKILLYKRMEEGT